MQHIDPSAKKNSVYFRNLELNKQVKKLPHISFTDIFLITKPTNSRLKFKLFFSNRHGVNVHRFLLIGKAS